jgi:L-galactose dehydrogenase
MEYRPLGATGLNVSAVSFGTGSLGELFGPLDESSALRLVDEVLDSGINFVDTSPYYGSAEYRLGKALTSAKREAIIIGTKTGRYGFADFDFSPARIRSTVESSLRLLGTDYVDILQLHDIEFVGIDPVLTDSFAELVKLKDEGKCRFIGMTGYPVKTFARVLEETDVDVILTYAKGNLLDNSLRDSLLPIADRRHVGVINAAAVSLGLLTPQGPNVLIEHPWPRAVSDAAARMVALASERGLDIAFLATQYAIQCSGAPTTVVGAGKSRHLQSAIEAANEPIDPELAAEFVALRPPEDERRWTMGLAENN